MDSTTVLVHDDRPDRLGQSADSTHDQSQCDVPEQAGRAIRPRLLPGQAHAAAQGPHGGQLQVLYGGQGPGRWRAWRAGDLRRHVPRLLRIRRGLSSGVRAAREGDHGRHSELHGPDPGHSDQRGRRRSSVRASLAFVPRGNWVDAVDPMTGGVGRLRSNP